MRTTTRVESAPDEVLIERFLRPAWRLALISTDDPVQAEEATVAGFVDGVELAERTGSPAIGTEIVSATRRAVLAKGAAAEPHAHEGDIPLVAAFRLLRERARAAVWLTEIEGGSPEQVAPVLGLDPGAAAEACERASSTLRGTFVDLVVSSVDDSCRATASRLRLHATGGLDETERQEVSAHLAGCRSCAVCLAMLVSPRPLLQRLATPPPEPLAAAVAARLAARHETSTPTFSLHPRNRVAIGTAAAAVLAVGIAAAAVSTGHDGDDGPELAAPAALELDAGSAAPAGPLRITATGTSPSSAAPGTAGTSRPARTPTSTPVRAVDRARGLASVARPSAPPSGAPDRSGPSPTAPGPLAPPDDDGGTGSGTTPGLPPLPLPDLPLPPLALPLLPVLPLPEAPLPDPAPPSEPTDLRCTGVELLDGLTGCGTATGDPLLAPLVGA